MKFNVGSLSFKSKSDAKKFFQNILYEDVKLLNPRYKWLSRIPDDVGDKLRELIKLHPHHLDIVGPGIDHFTTIQDNWGATCFAARRVDGTLHNFSYHASFDTHSSRVEMEIFRRLSRPDVARKATSHFVNGDKLTCSKGTKLCLGEITIKDFHSHHDNLPFLTLVENFCEREGLILGEIPLAPRRRISFEREFADPNLERRWIEYHELAAIVIPICSKCNMSLGARS